MAGVAGIEGVQRTALQLAVVIETSMQCDYAVSVRNPFEDGGVVLVRVQVWHQFLHHLALEEHRPQVTANLSLQY
jgi:hypothetical protein